MDKKTKLANFLKLKLAKDKAEDIFVIGNRLDDLEDKIDSIPQTDLTDIKESIDSLKNKLDEEIEINLEIDA